MRRQRDQEKPDLPPASKTGRASASFAGSMDRRRFLTRSASLVALGSASLLLQHAKAAVADPASDPMRVPGSPARAYGERSSFESLSRSAGDSHSLTPLQHLHGIVTPSSLHFERHHNGVPAID